MRRLLLPLLLLALLPVGAAQAEPFPVTNTKDDDGIGSLRASIEEANKNAGADTIPIDVSGTIELETALPAIFGNVSIVGPGADQLTVRRSSAEGFGILAFSSSESSISGLTVSNGRSELGGGIVNTFGSLVVDEVVVRDNEAAQAGLEAAAEGGGIHSEGPLTLRNTVITGNVARADGSLLTKARGGGVASYGPLTVEGSTISGNVAEARGEGTPTTAEGGGVLAETEATISRSTISGNAVGASGPTIEVSAQGGGIQTFQATLTASTLTGNSVASAGLALGANLNSALSTSARDTILADALGDANSCGGEISSGGYNLDEDGSCGLNQGSDLVGVPAGLDPALKDNGGPTPTHALLLGSVAIDRGNSFGSTIDQRGLPRPSDFPAISNKEGGDGSDIGAFELQVPPPTPILVRATPGDTHPPRTRIVSGPARVTFERLAKFRFASSEAQSHFQCKIDKRRWKGCASPFKRTVSAGAGPGRKHVFKVRAIDRFGNVDPTPARFGWRVKKIVG